jgi:hypothetical protein
VRTHFCASSISGVLVEIRCTAFSISQVRRCVGSLCDAAAMSRTIGSPVAAATTCLVLVFGAAGTAVADVPVGPGPTNYTVQPQPAPGTCHYRTAADGQILPDPGCTPGATNPKVTQDTLDTTICRTGYTKSIRPPKEITQAEKRANAAAYGYTGPFSGAEFDHDIALELGGDPNDPRNLWVQPQASPNSKDAVESQLHQLVCAGTVSLAAAQQAIAADWTTALDAVRR